MMKKTILLILLSQIAHFSFAGKGLIKEINGREYKCKKSDRETYGFENAIKVGKDHYLISRTIYDPFLFDTKYSETDPSDFLIYRLDEKMNVKAVVHIPAEIEGKFVYSHALKRFGDNICALFYFNNKKTRKQYLFAQQFNIETLEKVGSTYKIGEATINKTEIRLPCIFRVNVSDDYSKMLITADRAYLPLSGKQKKNARAQKNHPFYFWLIDSDFKLINGKKISLGKGHTIIVGQAFDNEGNMCFLGLESDKAVKARKSGKGWSSKEGTDRSHSKLVMKIIKPNDAEKDFSIAAGQFFYSAMMTINSRTGNVAVVGLIASGKYGASGIFTQQMNLSTGEILTESVEKFGTDLVKEATNLILPVDKKVEKKNKKRYKAVKQPANGDYIARLVRVGSCHYNDNNELVIVTQKLHTYKVTGKVSSGNQTYSTNTTYYVYGDIISFKLNETGKIENFGYVSHNHESTDDSWRDYSSLYTGQKLYLITQLDAVKVELNNKASKTERFNNNLEAFKDNTIYASYIKVSDSELLQVLNQKRILTFTLLSVNTDNE